MNAIVIIMQTLQKWRVFVPNALTFCMAMKIVTTILIMEGALIAFGMGGHQII